MSRRRTRVVYSLFPLVLLKSKKDFIKSHNVYWIQKARVMSMKTSIISFTTEYTSISCKHSIYNVYYISVPTLQPRGRVFK